MKEPQPPKWILRLLHFYCKPSKLEVIEGDLYELYDLRYKQLGQAKAQFKIVWDVLRFMRWRYIKGLDDIPALISIAMLKNYFKISIRSLWRHRFFAFINVLGLSVGIACCLAILVYVQEETSYDKFYPDVDRIFRVSLNERGTNTPAPMVNQMRQDFPEIETGLRTFGPYEATVQFEGQLFKQSGVFVADSTFFEVFQVPILVGNNSALVEPNSLVITKSLALKYFLQKDPIGQVIKIDGDNYKVTAVIDDCPKNSHIQYQMIVDVPREDWVTVGNWTGNNFKSYLKLKEGADPDLLQSKFQDFVEKYVGPELLKFTGHASFAEFRADGYKFNYHLIPVKDIHLQHPNMTMGGTPGNLNNIYIFSFVAFFVLLIACINFINLSTSRSAIRSKEVGIRKVLGSLRSQLIGQFLMESSIISIIALIIAFILVILILPAFNELSGKSFSASDVISFGNLLLLLCAGVVTGLIAGAYPAFYLSALKPLNSLKGVLSSKGSGSFLKKGLVSFQFAISISLIVFTVIVIFQRKHMTDHELGLNAGQTIVIKNAAQMESAYSSFKNTLEALPSIEGIALSSHYPSGSMPDWSYNTIGEGSQTINPYHVFADAALPEILDLTVVEGRFFETSRALDTTAVVINEAFLKELGWSDGVGKELSRGNGKRFKIIGVLKDFHFGSLRSEIDPLLFRFAPGIEQEELQWGGGNALVKVSANYEENLSIIQSEWEKRVQDEPFEYLFLDTSFDSLYEAERKFGQLFMLFSVLAIFIGCLGLFAIASFTLQRRLKEIAVRKVLGASITQLSTLLLVDFTKLIFLGAAVGIPVSYYAVDQWLSDFAYRISLNPLYFFLPLLVVLAFAWVTIGFQSFKAAQSNPAIILKDE